MRLDRAICTLFSLPKSSDTVYAAEIDEAVAELLHLLATWKRKGRLTVRVSDLANGVLDITNLDVLETVEQAAIDGVEDK